MSYKKSSWFSLHKLGYIRAMAFFILSFERFWPRIYPSLLALLLLLSLSWLGLFKYLSFWPHVILFSLLIFIACLGLFFLRGFQFPSQKEIDCYIEDKSNLINQPLSSLNDILANDDNGVTHALWQAHKRRMVEKLQNLQVSWPNPAFYRWDPYGLRTIIILLAVISFIFSFSFYGGRFKDSFDFRIAALQTTMRIDAFVTQPDYSGMAPIYLSKNSINEIQVLAGSLLTIQITGGGDAHLEIKTDENNKTLSILPIEDKKQKQADQYIFQKSLDASGVVSLQAKNLKKQWHFTIVEDVAPTIQFTKAPARILNGSLELNYKLDDDYGVTKAYSEISLLEPSSIMGQQLYPAPKIKLRIPRSGKGEMRMVQDISESPWAGAEVQIRLVAEDGKGQKAYSQNQIMTLPQRIFSNPLSRAVVEQRRILVSNILKRDDVLYMLDALMVRPADTYNNMTQFLALRSARTGLALANNQEKMRDSADYLWQIALNIENDIINLAEKRLKQAQAALRDALQNGASPEEIERLVEELNQAMQDYIAALGDQAPNSSLAQNQGERHNLSDEELQKKLQQLEDLAKTGNRGAAEQVLSELEALMDNLQVMKGAGGDGRQQANDPRNQMQKEIDKLADLMRRQQEALNDTHSLEDQYNRKEKSQEEYQENLDGIQKKQQELQQDLQNLQNELQQQGFAPSQQLQEAQKRMQESQNSLGSGEGAKSAENQSNALNAMREGAQDLMQKMREALKENQPDNDEDKNKSANSQDPLGRNTQDDGQNRENGVLPEESEIQKARRILEELRKRLGQDATPEIEKQYLERLLEFN